MSEFKTEFRISSEDSSSFARLSGDYNPLHIDCLIARRTRFGETVVHGIHLVLRVLDELAGRGLFDDRNPAAISGRFHDAVLTDGPVSLVAAIASDGIRFSATTSGRLALSGAVDLGSCQHTNQAVEDAEFTSEVPKDLDFPPAAGGGTVHLKVKRSLLLSLFPSLSSVEGAVPWIADLLATTQIVGMRCPGMNSIFSSFKLGRGHVSREPKQSMSFRLLAAETRFKLIRMEVVGGYFSGKVEAFFRPRPVQQLPMREVAPLVTPSSFNGDFALIVGGSRGLGEITAKILAAGGANTTITYARGRKDAERVCAEVRDTGGACTVRQLNINDAGLRSMPAWLSTSRFSHVYFFASPQIAANTANWDDTLFLKMSRIYVSGFAILVQHLLDTCPERDSLTRFFYPSSVFVADHEPGFDEYAAAKAAGEALCNRLEGRCGAHFFTPRLPRMRTDQTSALHSGVSDPLPIMLDAICAFRA